MNSYSCDFCRARKLKCLRERICLLCIKLGKRCVYSPRARRMPLSKKYVDELKHRIVELESIIEGLSKPPTEPRDPPKRPPAGYLGSPGDVLPFEDFHDVDNLVWSEGDDDIGQNLIDGMGALTVHPYPHSYYGITSSHGLLKLLEPASGQAVPNLSGTLQNTTSIDNQRRDILLRNYRTEFFNSYFSTYHKCFPILDEASVREQFLACGEGETDTKSFKDEIFQVLLNTILAIGALMKLGEGSIIDILYYQRVKRYLQKRHIMECGNYQLLESFVLLGNYVQKRNKPNTAWNYHGLGLRMAVAFGLHRELARAPAANFAASGAGSFRASRAESFRAENLSAVAGAENVADSRVAAKLERRRRLWWCLYYFDIGHSITFGRPLHTLSLDSIDIKLPVNPHAYPTIYSSLIGEAELAKVLYVVYSSLTSVQGAPDHAQLNELVEEMARKLPAYFHEDDEIAMKTLQETCPMDWYDITLDGKLVVPPWFTISRMKLIWRYKNLQILIFRRFVADTETTLEPVSYTAATYIIESASRYVAANQLDTHSSWYCTFFLFQAVLVPAMACLRARQRGAMLGGGQGDSPGHSQGDAQGDAQGHLDQIDLARGTLEVLGQYNTLAGKLIETVDALVGQVRHPSVDLAELEMVLQGWFE